MKRLLLVASVLLAPSALAQSADTVLKNFEAAQKNAKDISVQVQGKALLDSGEQRIDLEVLSIPGQKLTRVNFNAPDALADNVLVIDNQTAYNYLYLTNQVTVQPLAKTELQGFNFDFAQFARLGLELPRDRFDVKLVSTQAAKTGKTYVLEATPKARDLGFSRTRVWISDQGWRPVRLQALNSNGKLQADLRFENYKVNSGLSAAKVKSLPRDAQVIRKQ
ncbi:outer membrane lipoprotein-sorting protein [Deinobacterium chartae]|uniref:Outer membrane lipoprotein-sorting protein n=1 Tax=Deinobacterium chartae TaxID=521158 RepID=A0A841HYH4_9DEIO|nr:outer membrane lipoprotein carrier protein LolA [Deinobacterium chartae]MBB6097936.1 outer membrane lipoprotein-sorting protein [Deinobacterium chartae]